MKLRSLKAKALRLAGCEGKIRFTSFTRARQVAHRQSQRHGLKFQAYHCTACGGTHTGTANAADGSVGIARNSLQPFRVFAHNGDNVECFIGRAPRKDGGKLVEILKRDNWIVTRIVR